jgi:hypothetical protein
MPNFISSDEESEEENNEERKCKRGAIISLQLKTFFINSAFFYPKQVKRISVEFRRESIDSY